MASATPHRSHGRDRWSHMQAHEAAGAGVCRHMRHRSMPPACDVGAPAGNPRRRLPGDRFLIGPRDGIPAQPWAQP